MNEALAQEIRRETQKGPVRIRSFCSADEIQHYRFDAQFGIHAQYKSLYTKRESLEQNARQTGTNVTLALSGDDLIIGFGVLAYPDSNERWAQLQPRVMMEVKAIEVSRQWRAFRLGNGILEMLLGHPGVEDKIVYMVGYSWTWDLDGTKKTAQQYRRILIKLFEPLGFLEYQTNEPNICLKPENLFMGRVGKNVDDQTQNEFKWLRFGMTP
jgi:acetoin utilization protein AcuA